MAAPIDPAMRYIRKGSFGCVVEPALPNENKSGWVTYPKHVSKLFRQQQNYNSALNKTRKAYNLMGQNSGHTLNSYTHNYKTANVLPPTIKRNCAFENAEPIFVTRMPHLGISFQDIPNYMQPLLQLPIKTIVQQIYKLLTQVQSLQTAEYIHGDIRESNVMIDPQTGTMTIIDFDWLKPKDEFLATYPMGFYSNPPECLLESELRTEIDADTNIPASIDRFMMNVLGTPDRRELSQDFAKYYSGLLLSKVFGIKAVLNLKPYLVETLKEFQGKHKDALTYPSVTVADEVLFSTFDSYGLGFTLYELLETLYPGDTPKEVYNSISGRITNQGRHYTKESMDKIASILFRIKVIAMNMGHVSLAKRLTIQDAIQKFLAIPGITAFGPFQECGSSCSIMGGSLRTKRTKRNKRNKRSKRV